MINGFPLSPQQKRLWSLCEGDAASYRAHCAISIRGPLDAGRLRSAFSTLAARHEILRTSFLCLPGMTLPLQVVEEDATATVREHDFRRVPPGEREEGISRLLWQETPDDLSLAADLAAFGPEEHLLLVRFPALRADDAALGNLAADLARVYAGVHEDGAEEVMQYADLAAWQNELLEAEERAAGRDYWRRQAVAIPDVLPPAEVAPGAEAGFRPGFCAIRPGAELTAGAADLARHWEVPVWVVLHACWQILLWRLTEQPDVVVGTRFDGRRYAELKDAVGLLARFLPMRQSLAGDLPFEELVRRTAGQAEQYQAWQEYFSWEQAVGADGPRLAPLAFESREPGEALSLGGLIFEPTRRYACTERFALKLVVHQERDTAGFEVHFDPARLSRQDAERIAGRFEGVLASAARQPTSPIGDLDLLGEAEREWLLTALNDTAAALPEDLCIHELFEERASAAPDALAAVSGEVQVSYGELNRQANRVAARLRAMGVGPEQRVGLCAERSPEMLAGILGILKAGAAYVPLDPSYPPERLAFLLEDSRAAVVLAQERLLASLSAHRARALPLDSALAEGDSTDPARAGTPDNLAYVIYTSGSTGRPKGVQVTHRNLVHSTQARRRLYGEPGRQLLLASFAFDSSVAGIFWSLCFGGTLVLPPDGAQREPRFLTRHIAETGVTVFIGLPSVFALLLQEAEPGQLDALQTVIVAGEVCPRELVNRQRRELPRARLYNEYGPTEGTVWSTIFECTGGGEDDGPVPIGRAIENVQIYLLHSRLGPVPTGSPGELFVGGAGLARGYLERPELTAERFLPSPFSSEPGSRLYRTGDLVRRRGDGEIEFLGRVDEQVKIRGYRVELGEIESLLESHPAVQQAAVVVREETPGNPQLAAFLVPDERSAGVVLRRLRLEADGRLEGHRTLELPNGMPVVQHSRSETEFLYREIFEEASYLRHGISLPDGACVFDVGANIGAFTLFAASRCKDPVVFAFEPIPPICEILRLNAELHGVDARVLNCGVAGRRGVEAFTFYPNLSLMSGRFVDLEEDRRLVRTFEMGRGQGSPALEEGLLDELLVDRLTTERFTCEVRTLSDVIREHGVECIDLLKIDAEKSELDVLAGLAEEDWPRVRQMVIETQEADLRSVVELLERHGFEVAVESDTAVAGGGLCNVFARRPGQAATPATAGALSAGIQDPDALLEEVRRSLHARVPDYMVPPSWRLLSSLPQTPNGKVDRRALARLEPRRAEGKEHAPPRNPVEETLAGIWGELLGLDRVSVAADFFELGGHSLVATQVMSRVREAFHVELPVRSLFRSPTVAGLAQAVVEAQRESRVEAPPIRRAPGDQPRPLSFAQQRLWLAHQLDPQSPAYNIPSAVRLSGDLWVAALQGSLGEIVRRHEILRTVFPLAGDRPVQVVQAPSAAVFPVIDLSALPPAGRDGELARIAREEAHLPFDLAHGPLLRASLVRLGEREHVSLLTMHHIVSDAWSTGVLVRELAAHYQALLRGTPSTLPELPVQYADFASWQRDWLQGETLEAQLEYWRRQLGGGLPRVDLPTDWPRPPIRGTRAGKLPLELPEDLSAALRGLAQREGATMFMVLLAAFKVLLHALVGQDDVVVGTNVANRNRIETEGLIGFFINQLVLRTDLAGDPSFRELLGRVRETALGAYAHQDLPFDRLVEDLQPERDLSRPLLFQVKLELQNAPMSPLELPGLTVAPVEIDRRIVRYDLHLSLTEGRHGVGGAVLYSAELFEEATVSRLIAAFSSLLASVAASPGARLSELEQGIAEAERKARNERREQRRKQNLAGLKMAQRQAVTPGLPAEPAPAE